MPSEIELVVLAGRENEMVSSPVTEEYCSLTENRKGRQGFIIERYQPMPCLSLAAVDMNNAFCKIEIAPPKVSNLNAAAGRVHRDDGRAVCGYPFILARCCFEQTCLVFR